MLRLSLVFVAVAAGQTSRDPIDQLAAGNRAALPLVVKQGEAALPKLANLLDKNNNADVRALAAQAIGQIARNGGKAKAAIPALGLALLDDEYALTAEAGRALGYLGPDAVDTLVAALEKGRPTSVLPAARALAQIGPAAKSAGPALRTTLAKLEASPARAACIEALGAVGDKEAVPALVAIVRKGRAPQDLASALVALGTIGPAAQDAIPALEEVLRTEEVPTLRLGALLALAQIDPASKRLSDLLGKQLQNPTMPRVVLLDTFAKVGKTNKALFQAAETCLRDRETPVRLMAAEVIGARDPNNPAVVSVLIEALDEKEPQNRRRAAELLGKLRPEDDAVVDALRQHAADANPAVQHAIRQALKRFEK